MIFDDGRQMLRLEVIDTGFFDEDMTLELFGDEGEPNADGIRRVPDVKAIWSARSARWRIRRRTRPRPARRMGAGGTRRPGP